MPSGKREILFKRPKRESATLHQLKLPCGKCLGCRLERSRQWAMRCMHEASQFDRNSFITLTYDDQHLPAQGSLVKRDFQLFMKRLRKEAGATGIRFFACGEYGGKKNRPHYHACLFNFDFADKYFFKKTDRGDKLYRSPMLERVWPFGQSMIGSVTFESAAYVARYVCEKIDISSRSPQKIKQRWEDKYVDKSTGVIREPEFVLMSRGCKKLGTGGIGKGFFQKFKSDMYPRDYAILRGRKVRPPRFYDKLYDIEEPENFAAIKKRRVKDSVKLEHDNTDERLRVKEEVKRAQMRTLSRPLEA